MSSNHLVAIRAILHDLRQYIDDTDIHFAEEGLGDIESHAEAMANELAEANTRAETQRRRAERLAQAIMGLCDGDANDIEFELDLYPMDLYDQTGDDNTPPETVTIRNDDGTTSTFHVFGQLSAEGDDE